MELSEEEKKAIDYLKENSLVRIENEKIVAYGNSYKLILLNLVEKQQKEIEEKRIIIFAGAEKVKQLEKGNRSLMESRIKWKNRYYKEKAKNKEYISKDKIRQKIKEVQETVCPNCCACGLCDEFKELLEEN